MIALFVSTMPTRPARRIEVVSRMAEIVTVRRQLSDEKVAAENASRLLEDPGRYNPVLKIFYQRLAKAGKKSKVIIVAVMRKMITTLNAIVRDNTAWNASV